MSMNRFLGFILFFLLLNLASSKYISEEVFKSHRSSGRSLLQDNKKICPMTFENKNYAVITSKCKGPKYSADLCCNGFKQFACPYAEIINDMQTDCADIMFMNINLHGNYPPGIFADLCKGDEYGLSCDGIGPANDEPKPKVSKTSL